MTQSFDEVHVISDLHFGGKKGFQIFDQGRELAALIGYLKMRETKKLALVLNGDIVDFLAEEPPTYLDTEGAVQKLQRIFTAPAFAPVWDALAEFVKKAGRHLVLVLGNHDVELALPAVQEAIMFRLCGNSAASRGRVLFAIDGAGFACQVGGRNVLCLHGNEVDTWNVVDYAALLDTRRAINRVAVVPEWEPNAGTKLVIDVMNPIKRQFPFVDLLKPETSAVPAMLVALDSGVIGKLHKMGPVLSRLARDSVRRSLGFLSAEIDEERVSEDSEIALRDMLSASYKGIDYSKAETVDELLDRVENLIQSGEDDQYQSLAAEPEMLGITGVIVDRILRRSPAENLRESLGKWLGSDKTFDHDQKDETYRKLDEAVGPEVDFLVAGHTHLERSIPRGNGSGAYFNSGTWIRLIKLEREVLRSKSKFAKVFERIEAGTMEALDKPTGLVLRRPTVVSIEKEGQGVIGELRRVRLSGNGIAVLKPVAGSRQVR